MFVDASAILTGEPEAGALADVLDGAVSRSRGILILFKKDDFSKADIGPESSSS